MATTRRLYRRKKPRGRGLPLMQILRNVTKFPSDRPGRALMVKVVGLRVGRSRATGLVTFVARTSSPELYGLKWKVMQYATSIAFLDEKRVKLSCSCPDFLYRWEWALWNAGSADIRYCNGEPPFQTNPRAVPALCKHLIKLTSDVVDLGKMTRRFYLNVKLKPPKVPQNVQQNVLKSLPRMTTKRKAP